LIHSPEPIPANLPTASTTMHLLKYNPEAKTLTEVPPSEFDADPTCRYFYVLGNRAHVPIVTPDGIGEIVWEHPRYQPPKPANQHRATPEQWAKVKGYAPGLEVCSCLLEIRDRIEALEATQHAHAITGPTNQLHSYKVGPAEPFEDWGKGHTQVRQHRATPEQWAFTESRGVGDPVYATCSCLLELRDRIQLLEATQHAHIEAKASEAGARCAVEQLRSKPGSWQPIKTETTYGSDATTPELSQSDVKAAEMEWARTAPGMRSDATDQVLALQDQIRDGSLTLAKALEKINGDDQPVQQFIAKYLFNGDILQDSFCYDPSDSNSVSFDIANLEPVNGCLKPGDNIKIAHRWGELPASGVYSTINYKVASVSERDDRVWTIRAVRVDTSDSEPAPTADDQLTLVERVADAIDNTPLGERHRAAIRDVAKWLRSEYPLLTLGTAAWANLLDNEANR
jgi:hypothetical protein